MIDLDPTLTQRLAQPHDPAPGRSLTARALGGLAIGISSAGIALYGLGAALVEYRLWPL